MTTTTTTTTTTTPTTTTDDFGNCHLPKWGEGMPLRPSSSAAMLMMATGDFVPRGRQGYHWTLPSGVVQ